MTNPTLLKQGALFAGKQVQEACPAGGKLMVENSMASTSNLQYQCNGNTAMTLSPGGSQNCMPEEGLSITCVGEDGICTYSISFYSLSDCGT